MSHDPRSPSDAADLAPDDILVCRWCDEQIDQSDLSVEAFEFGDGPTCKECFEALCESGEPA